MAQLAYFLQIREAGRGEVRKESCGMLRVRLAALRDDRVPRRLFAGCGVVEGETHRLLVCQPVVRLAASQLFA